MSTETVAQTSEYTVEKDTEHGIPIFVYNEFASGEDLREIADRWAEVIEEEDAERYLVNTEEIAAHDDADKQWLADTWVPNLIDRGVRAGAGVYADSAIADMEMRRVEETLSSLDPDFEYRVFGTQSEALDWLADQ
ncbi:MULTISPECIES: hypothetical protein [Halorussus]|uniref:hypothetical protein n=1 Tax=Halorussus TaxID=1070314 RepID=UPI00209EB150|nr:hypothetical protein [Halorussus vallis]USZ74978.1 hypothetical protein NGM07_16255 [Halorussus vallis]